MRVTVVRPGDLGPGEVSLWAAFQQTSPVTLSPFLSLTFARVVGRYRPDARVAVVEADGQIEAFLPFELAPRGIAMPIGYPMNDLQGFVGRGTPIDARRVIRQAGLRGWRFVAAPAQQRALVPHHYAGTLARVPVIDLSNGYQHYLSSRKKESTKRIAEKRRALERRLGTSYLTWSSPRPQQHLRQLIDWKTAKYGGARQLFSDPAARRILEELTTGSGDDCRGLLSVLSAGERTVALFFGLIAHGGLSSWFPAYDRELSRYSPGRMMWQPLAEKAACRGITRLDLGYGQDQYKFGLANASYVVAGGAVWASRCEQAARSGYRRLRGRASRARGLSGGTEIGREDTAELVETAW
jgi:CelD/BcsL family acetyltransferase involved in cellulose biosynthesis